LSTEKRGTAGILDNGAGFIDNKHRQVLFSDILRLSKAMKKQTEGSG
jgi:hypothetical protein